MNFFCHALVVLYYWQLGCQQALGGGVSDVIAFFNGVEVKNALNFRVLVFKLFGLFCATASGVPIGSEGPLIAVG